jgi:hypothetical protein
MPITMSGFFKSESHFAKYVCDAGEGVAAADIHHPFRKYGPVCGAITPEGLRDPRVARRDTAKFSMGDVQDGGRSKRRKPPTRLRTYHRDKVCHVTWYVKTRKLPLALVVLAEPADQSFDQ